MTKEFPIKPFASPKEWNAWLAKNHKTSDGLWLRLYKKDSGQKTITHAEALDEALCYGWIDGQLKKYDEVSWLRKFTPRRPGSLWSKRNIELVERLTKEGRMKPAGLEQIKAAEKDDRLKQAYDSPKNMTVPQDFLQELEKDKKALAFFQSLNKANVYAIAWRLQTAKKPETRERRMNIILDMLKKGQKIHE